MPAQLSKLHVRFIQTQKSFILRKDDKSNGNTLPLKRLYIKNNSSFYFVNQDDNIQERQALSLLFNASNDYLKSLQCGVAAQIIEKGSDEYEDALLFFHLNESDVKQLILLTAETISDT